MEKTKTAVILIALTVLAFALRWYLMPSHLFFGPEQGRDFLVIRDIVENHKLTLIGSKTDIDGVFHGPVYYYLAAIPFTLSRGNPVFVAAFFTILQSVSVFLAYALAYEISKNKRTGLIAAALFSVNYLFVVYSRWLSNPPLSIPLSLVFMLFLFRYIKGKPWYLVATAFVYGILGQVEFINFLLFGVVGATSMIVYRKQFVKTRFSIIVITVFVALVASFASYILFDLRHDFLVTNGITNLLLGKSGYKLPIHVSVWGAFHVLMEQVAQVVGLSGWKVGCIVLALLLVKKYHAFLYLWFCVPFLVFSLLRHGMLDQLYAGVVGVFILLIALWIERLWEKKAIVGMSVLMFVLFLNGRAVVLNFPDNYRVFFQPQQPAVRYTDQLTVVDWVYKAAAGRPFEFQAYTIPYFLQQAWIYLFDWRGQRIYGYMPTPVDRKLLYVIIQKDRLDPLYQKNWYDKTVSTWGTKTKEFTVGEYTVEERMP